MPPASLELLALDGLPAHAVAAFESALATVCATTATILDEATDTWRVEGVRDTATADAALPGALALAAAVTALDLPPVLNRVPIAAEGWLARTAAAFPEQPIGRRFLIRPTHLPNPRTYGRIVLRLDAGLAFGSGEHASTQGCLMAFEAVAYRRPRRILDLGTGSGILGLAAAAWLRVPVLATDNDPWAVRVAGENARLNRLHRRFAHRLSDGWRSGIPKHTRFDLIFANILARPLCAMAHALATHLAPGGTAILAGLLRRQAPMVLAAHRRCGLHLQRSLQLNSWCTLILRR
jgi:ribosomal protein L11 methyltransferase